MQLHWSSEESEHHRKERVYWVTTAVLTFVAVAGAIATVILSQLSLQEARRATREAEKATAEAHRQADASETQIAVAKSTAAKQLRAYVSVKPSQNGVKNFGSSLTASLKIIILNSGQTPAIDLTISAILFPRPFPLPKDMDLTIPNPANEASRLTLHPRDTEFGSTLTRTIEPLGYDAIKTGIGRLYTFGIVNYKDIFGVEHWTQFCYYFEGDGPNLTEWTNCSRYNDTDKNE